MAALRGHTDRFVASSFQGIVMKAWIFFIFSALQSIAIIVLFDVHVTSALVRGIPFSKRLRPWTRLI